MTPPDPERPGAPPDESDPTAPGARGLRGRVGRRLGAVTSRRRRHREARNERIAERFADRMSTQWQYVRERRVEDRPIAPIVDGPTRVGRAEVPWALDLAAAWSWRFLMILLAGSALVWGFWYVRVISIPVVIALLLTALVGPVVGAGQRLRLPRRLAALLTVVGGLGLVSLLLTFVGQQVADGAGQLGGQLAQGVDELEQWLRTGPLEVSGSQISDALNSLGDTLASGNTGYLTRATEVTTAVGHVVAGFFIIVFSTYFFLADGNLIWSWLVRLFPAAARTRVDRSGRVAWHSLTQFVRATVLVAATDAIGVMIVAALLDVPFVLAIGVLVFLGAFVPMIGATVSGSVAVLVALVAQGPVVALLMLGGVILVQQIEAHVLQPFLMGRFVSVHPLGVILAIGVGVIVAGIVGALIAVPLAASLNAVIADLARQPVAPGGPLADTGPLGDDPEPEPA